MESILCLVNFVAPELSFVFYTFSYTYFGLTWQGLGSGGGCGCGFSEKTPEASRMSTETVPIGFKMDPLLAKSESMSEVGRNFYDKLFKKIHCTAANGRDV